MGTIISKMTNCLPIGIATGVIPPEYVEETMEELMKSYDDKISFCDDSITTLTNEAILLKKRHKLKQALEKYKRVKLLEAKKANYEKQKLNIESQLTMATDSRLTIETIKVMGEHRNILTREYGEQAVEEATKLMDTLRDQQGDMEQIQRTLAEPLADATDIDYSFADDNQLMQELEAIAFAQGENTHFGGGGTPTYYEYEPPTYPSTPNSSIPMVKNMKPTPSTHKIKSNRKHRHKSAQTTTPKIKEETLSDILGNS